MASADRSSWGRLFLGLLLVALGVLLLFDDDAKSTGIIIGHGLMVLLGAALLAMGISLRLKGRREH